MVIGQPQPGVVSVEEGAGQRPHLPVLVGVVDGTKVTDEVLGSPAYPSRTMTPA